MYYSETKNNKCLEIPMGDEWELEGSPFENNGKEINDTCFMILDEEYEREMLFDIANILDLKDESIPASKPSEAEVIFKDFQSPRSSGSLTPTGSVASPRSTGSAKKSTKSLPVKHSNFRGVSWYRRTQKWTAQIKHQGVRKHLGYFTNEMDAVHAYRAYLKKIIDERQDATQETPASPAE